MFNLARTAFFLMIFLPAARALFAEQLSFESSEGKKTSLIEVYSSQGCSSCPPAHRWISGFKDDPGLWKDFIPVVFHVDYWDQLGWKDKFSSALFTERQRKYFLWWGESTLFTPCIISNGELLQKWSHLKKISPVSQNPGNLKVEVLGEGWYQLSFRAEEDGGKKMTGHMVLLGLGIKSKIERGENAGKNFTHDFTVLDYKREPLEEVDHTAQFELGIPEAAAYDAMPQKLAVAGWVSEGIDPAPVQAAGGYLENFTEFE